MSSATALLADAESSISSGAWDQALEQLEQIKQSEPAEANVYRRLAHVQAIRGKFRSVVQTYVDLIGVLVESDDLSEAEEVISKVLSLHPECEAAREKRIEIEKKRGNVDRAVYLARELARLCIEQGDGDRSIRLLQEAQADQPENLDISLELAEMFVSHGQIQDGANQYRKVANAFQEVGNISKAAEAYRRMKVVQSDDPDVLLTLGRLYTELGKLDEAEQEFRSVLRHDLEHQDALLELGLVCQLKGRFRSGLLAFNKVLQNNPKLPRAMRKLGELNLSMGKQDEAVQHFLEAAQAYLEVEERDQAIEIFQIVLGVDGGNGQAQQGLTNLGAPLEPLEFQPPLPPTPPEEEAPTPEASPVSADLGEMPPPANEPEPEPEKASKPPSKLKSGSSAPGGRRKGLVGGGMGLRKGLVSPGAGPGGGGGKPMLGGKPTLGGSGGSPRAGLRRPGLGMKGPGGDKPMLGMKPTLSRRRGGDSGSDSSHSEPSAAMHEEDDNMVESVFDSSESDSNPSAASIGLENQIASAANELFDDTDDVDSPFDEGFADSLFDPDDSAPEANASTIGAQGGDSDFNMDDEFGMVFDDEDSPGEDGDIFGMGGGEGDLFGDPEPAGDLFGDEGESEAGSLFNDAEESAGEDLFSALEEPSGATMMERDSKASPSEEEDLFGDNDQFDNLFDDNGVSSDTIGGSVAGDDLFGDAAPTAEQPVPDEDSAFDSLFSEAPAEEAGGVDDLFSTDLDFSDEPQEAAAEESLFGGGGSEAEGGDLFGEDLFPSAEAPEPSTDATSDDDLFGGGDLFGDSEPVSESPAGDDASDLFGDDSGGSLFEDSPSESAGLFEESNDGDDLFGGGDLFGEPESGSDFGSEEFAAPSQEEPEPFDLFSAPEPVPAAEEESDSAAGLFDGFDDAPSGSDEASEADDLFSTASPLEDSILESSDGGDLFGEVETESEPVSSDEFGGGGLFDDIEPVEQGDFSAESDAGDLFDIPEPASSGGLFDESPIQEEAAAGLFDEPAVAVKEDDFEDFSSGSGLFDEPAAESAEVVAAEPLGLDLPMPGDPPAALESPVSPQAEMDSGLFEDGGDLFTEEPVSSPAVEQQGDGVTMDQLLAEERARVVDVPEDQEADSPEFMKLLELTLPKSEEDIAREAAEEARAEEVLPEAVSPAVDEEGGGLFDTVVEPTSHEAEALFDSGDSGLFEAEPEPELEPVPEPEPEPEGPDILGKPKVSLSIEDESPASDIEQADLLDQSLREADVAAKISGYRKALEDSHENLVMRTRLADIHLKYGMLEDALLQYRQCARKNPESISLLHRLIQAEFWTENYSEACGSLLELAKLHLKRGEHHDALDTLQSVLSLDSHHFEARKVLVSVFTTLDESKLAAHHLRQLAETAMTKGEVSEAISAFEQLLEISNDPVFEERLAQIYESQGDMEKALTSFQSLVGRYQNEERWEEAARVTERIVELNPEALDDRGALVDLYKKLGMIDKAMEQQFKLAHAYQAKGELEPSIRLYEGVLEFNSDDQTARRLLVDAYLDSGNVESALQQSEALTEYYLHTRDHQTAIELYSRLVEADPENVELQERLVKFYGLAGDLESARSRWISLADLHESRGRFQEAADAIHKSLELEENQVDLQHRLALIYAEKIDDKMAALTQLRKLFQMAPERLDAVNMYIDLLLKQEQVSEAGQVLQRLEQAGGESVAIKNNVISTLRDQVESNPADLKARFNYGELCYHLGDLDHAIEQFQQTRRNPDYELLSYNMLGLCFAKKKGFNMLDLAIKQFKKGLETRGHSEQSYLELRYNLAMIQYQNGRMSEALSDFKECYRVDITYRDVRSWIEKIETELASSGS